MKKKITNEVIARHKYTNTEYIYAEICGIKGNLVRVSTKRAWPATWLIERFNVEILEDSSVS